MLCSLTSDNPQLGAHVDQSLDILPLPYHKRTKHLTAQTQIRKQSLNFQGYTQIGISYKATKYRNLFSVELLKTYFDSSHSCSMKILRVIGIQRIASDVGRLVDKGFVFI